MLHYCDVAHLWLAILYRADIGGCAANFYKYAVNDTEVEESPGNACCRARQDSNNGLAPKSAHICDSTITLHYQDRSSDFFIPHSRLDKLCRACRLRQDASVDCCCKRPYFKSIDAGQLVTGGSRNV